MVNKTIRLGDVFIPGGQPTFTYYPRENLNLENKVKDYLISPYKILSITGPTKSGKTVLVRKLLHPEEACWISGAQLTDLNELWDLILDRFQVYTTHAVLEETSRKETKGRKLAASVKPGGIGGGAQSDYSTSAEDKSGETRSRTAVAGPAALQVLLEHNSPLVIDDFHYIESELELKIVSILKQFIFNGLPVILLSIPHRAYDAIRINREMTGRVKHIRIPSWEEYELAQIADSGFEALSVRKLNLNDMQKLVQESLCNPLLMQEFCLQLCQLNGITQEQKTVRTLKMPKDWAKFFSSVAEDMAKPTFDRLAMGPKDRENPEIDFTEGRKGNVYEAILMAISNAGAKEELKLQDIWRSLQDILTKPHEVKDLVPRALEDLSSIARHEISGEPVVEWDKEYTTLHIADPFFAFYLKWGPHAETAYI